jgi:vanillate O-demethylase monooxygenase subunit
VQATDPAEQTDLHRYLTQARRYWHPVARSDQVPPNTIHPVEVLGEELLLWRAADTTLTLLDDRCPHRGARLSDGDLTAGRVRCPYHAWEFAPEGGCQRIPQLPDGPIPRTAQVTRYRVDEHAGLVWACLVPESDQARPRPTFAHADAGTHHLLHGEPLTWEANSFRQIENFCDVAHFSVLHTDTFGDPATLDIAAYRAERSADGWQLRFLVDYPAFGAEPVPFDYGIDLPFTVCLAGAAGPGTAMFIHSTPLGPARTRIFWVTAFPADSPVDPEAFFDIEDRIWAPDRRIVERQRPPMLPLHDDGELHLPFDRFAVAYRRALVDLGF